jgi:UDP-glucuronate decarboxylase
MHPNDGRVVSNFIVQALLSKPITIYGDGSQTRSFCYIDDMVDALIRLMNTPDDFTGPMNLGNPDEFSILELADLVILLTNSSSEIVYKSLPQDDPVMRKPDISLAKEKIRWTPKIKLQKGLVNTIAYFDNLLVNSS